MMQRDLPIGSRSTGSCLKCYTSSMRILMMFMVLAAPSVAAPPNPEPAQVTEKTKTKVENPEPNAARPFKRLVLKDGSYEPINKYELKGKLVRYFSSERHEWEELPDSLMDWAATEKYAEENAAERQVRRRNLQKQTLETMPKKRPGLPGSLRVFDSRKTGESSCLTVLKASLN